VNVPEAPGQIKVLPEERVTSLYMKLDRATAERLDSLRRQNDGDVTAEQTAKLLGRISEIKKLRVMLAMDVTSPAQEADG
jgi:hypothetical protein